MASNVDVVARYLRRRGLTPAQVAGVIGTMQGESGKNLDPGAVNPSSGATGIAQWLGGRKNAAVMTKKLGPQLDHLWEELQGPERAAFQKLKSAHTVEEATKAFLFGFERPGANEANLSGRLNNARSVLGLAKQTTGGGLSASAGRNEGRSTAGAVTIGGGTRTVDDPEAQKRVVLANFLRSQNPNNLLLKLGIVDPNENTSKTVTDPGITVPGSRSQSSNQTSASGVSGSLKGGKSGLFELIHKGDQAYAVKNGRDVDPSVYASVWDAHANHVHVAAGPNTVVKLGKLAQRMGLHVGENPHFGGVAPVHVKGSYHYKGEAIDVSGDPHKMNAYAKKVKQIYGLK
jgi:hypothetical protein